MLGDLVTGEFEFAMRDQVLFCERRVLPDNTEVDGLPRDWIRAANRRDFADTGMHRDHAFDLIGENVETGDQDHILDPIDNS